ncbi:MAG: ATP-dependent Clp protease ATP-binding subunit [Rikenellaceae bacterium]
MRSIISKSLGGMIARATFTATKHGIKRSLLDHLFLEIISFEHSHAFQTLASLMEPWQLYQFRMKVEQSLREIQTEVFKGENNEEIDPELYYSTFMERLMDRYHDSIRITSLHAIYLIICDKSTYTSKYLEIFEISKEQIYRAVEESTITHEVNSKTATDHHTLDATEHPHYTSDSTDTIPDTLLEHEQRKSNHPLAKFGTELTLLAHEGKIEPVIGREVEIERVTQILSRRKKNNPIILGEAGVGKSAIIEGLALRIASGDVPHTIKDKRLFSLDLSSLIAGTKFRGEFEERMKSLIDALRESQDSIIFIDEIHTIVGAGGSSQGSLDVANILKPALARGELQVIGATTLDEYRQDIEGDAALVRRFQKVLVEPSTEAHTLLILQNIAPYYEKHHQVKYSEEAIVACVTLSMRYITDQQLPDKAIDLLDEAGTLAQISTDGVGEIGVAEVEKVVRMITGIPAERINKNESNKLKGLADHLRSKVIGQDDAVDSIARTIKRSRVGLRDERRPIGTFLFVGATGVGKTLIAKELAKSVFDRNNALVRIDMSEYSLAHNVARLIGSPPGYVGYGEGGQLTEPVRRNPYSLVLLDEIEKAHSDVYNLLLQLLDEGHLTDGSGRRVDFRNTIIIMTSNVGSRKIADTPPRIGFGVSQQPTPPHSGEYNTALKQKFSPEFLNRIDDIVIFNDLRPDDIEKIVDLELKNTFDRIQKLGYNVEITPSARKKLAEMGYDKNYGARSMRRTVVEQIEDPISNMIIDEIIKRDDTIYIEQHDNKVKISIKLA